MRTTLLLLLISLNSYCQDYPKIEGIGKFKINKTTIDIIDSLKKELNLPVVIHTETKFVNPKIANVLAEVVTDTTKDDWYLAHINASLCKGVRVFTIGNYYVSGIELQNVALKFHNGVLFSFECNYSKEFNEALELKYGKPVLDKKEKASKCKSDLGEVLNESTITSKWINDSIIGTMTYLSYYNSQCVSRVTIYFSLDDKNKSFENSTCNKQAWEEVKARRSQRARASLKDF